MNRVYLSCLGVFLLLASFGVSFGVMPASAQSCGTVGYFYAVGQNNETYSKYGVSSTQTIYVDSLCGTSGSTGSETVKDIGVYTADGAWVAVGYDQGSEPNGAWTGNTPHYYRDENVCGFFGCSYSYSDISAGFSTYPSSGDSIFFQLQGSLNTGTHKWYITITKSGSYTLNINGISAEWDYGSSSTAQAESHNNVNSMTGYFSSLQNLEQTSSNTWTWTSWGSSYGYINPTTNNPYYYVQYDVSDFGMYTS